MRRVKSAVLKNLIFKSLEHYFIGLQTYLPRVAIGCLNQIHFELHSVSIFVVSGIQAMHSVPANHEHILNITAFVMSA